MVRVKMRRSKTPTNRHPVLNLSPSSQEGDWRQVVSIDTLLEDGRYAVTYVELSDQQIAQLGKNTFPNDNTTTPYDNGMWIIHQLGYEV